MATYRTTFIVQGTGVFPFDMLRYDGCHPYTGTDVKSMLTAFNGSPAAIADLMRVREVKLCRIHVGKDPRLTADRWSSFTWRLKLDSIDTAKVG